MASLRASSRRAYYFYDEEGLAAMVHSHVDDFLIAQRKGSNKWKSVIASLEKKLYLKPVTGVIKYCGRTITKLDDEYRVTQATAATQIDFVGLNGLRGRGAEDRLATSEVSSTRSGSCYGWQCRPG